MKLSLILIALVAIIISTVLALPTPEREDIVRDIKFKRDSNFKIVRRKEKESFEFTPEELEKWAKKREKEFGAGKRDVVKKFTPEELEKWAKEREKEFGAGKRDVVKFTPEELEKWAKKREKEFGAGKRDVVKKSKI